MRYSLSSEDKVVWSISLGGGTGGEVCRFRPHLVLLQRVSRAAEDVRAVLAELQCRSGLMVTCLTAV